jgi:hypothetical protein
MKSLNSTFNSHLLQQTSTQDASIKAPHNLILTRNTHFPAAKGASVDLQASQRTLGSLRNHLEFSKPTIFDQMLTEQ